MNIQQLEYIIALDNYRQYVVAAEKSFVTQATLSIMVKKLEEELGAKIFDRSKQPLVPTEAGKKIIAQARIAVQEFHKVIEVASQETHHLSGVLNLGIIPTLSPYLLPLFVDYFLKNYPAVKLKISELTTATIIRKLENGELDAGLLAIPTLHPSMKEIPLFKEEFVVYAPATETTIPKKFVVASEIDVNRLMLLEEGHCLTNQVINLCGLKELEKDQHQLDFHTGSLETLKQMVEIYKGITVLPRLAVDVLTPLQQESTFEFQSPVPYREIGIVTYRHFIKENILRALQKSILQGIPEYIECLREYELPSGN